MPQAAVASRGPSFAHTLVVAQSKGFGICGGHVISVRDIRQMRLMKVTPPGAAWPLPPATTTLSKERGAATVDVPQHVAQVVGHRLRRGGR